MLVARKSARVGNQHLSKQATIVDLMTWGWEEIPPSPSQMLFNYGTGGGCTTGTLLTFSARTKRAWIQP